METVDIPDTSGSADTSIETQPGTPEAQSSPGTQTQPQAAPKYVPFAQGKEKFKVAGQEHEWDWDTTKRYAQLGRSGQQAMERAAAVEKSAKDAYNKLLKAAESDPEGLLEVLNPNYKRRQAPQAGESPTQDPAAAREQGPDPRDLRIQKLEEHFENQEVEKERTAIASELDAAVKQFPILDDPIYRDHVKAQYRRHLQNGIEDISIEDVAFHVAQQLEERKVQAEKAKVERLKEKSRTAPVGSQGASSAGGSGKGMTRADVLKLAGRV